MIVFNDKGRTVCTVQKINLLSPTVISKVAQDLRDEDKAEVLYAHKTVIDGLTFSIVNSTEAYQIKTPDGDIAALCGWKILASPMKGVKGYGFESYPIMPWFLSTKYFPKIGISVTRYLKEYLAYYIEEKHILFNYVPKNYPKAIHWLHFLGFRSEECDDPNFYLMIKGKNQWEFSKRP